MNYEIYDWGGVVPWLLRQDGTFLVDPRYIQHFLDMMAEYEIA
jgi:hypothetical protein